MVDPKVLERVRKMLAMARHDRGNEQERDNAMRAVHAYLAKYNLDLATVEAAPEKKKSSESNDPRVSHPVTFYGRPWARAVCTSIGKMLFCEYLYVSATKAKNTRHYFIGRYSNAVTAALMSEYLVDSIMREGKRRMRAAGEGNPWFRSFALGAAVAIAGRVEALLRAEKPVLAAGEPAITDDGNPPATRVATPGTAVALASLYDRERDANRGLIAERFGKLGTGRSGKGISDIDATFEGRRYGEAVSLNRQVR